MSISAKGSLDFWQRSCWIYKSIQQELPSQQYRVFQTINVHQLFNENNIWWKINFKKYKYLCIDTITAYRRFWTPHHWKYSWRNIHEKSSWEVFIEKAIGSVKKMSSLWRILFLSKWKSKNWAVLSLLHSSSYKALKIIQENCTTIKSQKTEGSVKDG